MENDNPLCCIKRTKSIFLFIEIENNELYFTIKGKVIKFTTFSKLTNLNEHIFTEHLNDMMNQKKIDNLLAYHDYKRLNENFRPKAFIMMQMF